MVQSHARLKSFVGKKFTCSFSKSFSENIEIFLVHRKACCHFVPAKFVQPVCATA